MLPFQAQRAEHEAVRAEVGVRGVEDAGQRVADGEVLEEGHVHVRPQPQLPAPRPQHEPVVQAGLVGEVVVGIVGRPVERVDLPAAGREPVHVDLPADAVDVLQ